MGKIHNNLTIENLIKTEWFNQFNEEQQEEIIKGLEANLDVSIYAKPDFDDEQMDQIISGLLNNLDVSIYANPGITADMMFKIREELLTKKRYGF